MLLRELGFSAARLLRCSAMSAEPEFPLTAVVPQSSAENEVAKREAGLHKRLSSRQVAMIGLGCTIGTGLFLGSAISVKRAGPAVILVFAASAVITLTVMWALAEMAGLRSARRTVLLYARK